MLALFRADRSLAVEETDYHSIKLRRGTLKVSLHSAEHYLAGLSPVACCYTLDGVTFDGVDNATLIEAYARGADTIPLKRDAYLGKLAVLERPFPAPE